MNRFNVSKHSLPMTFHRGSLAASENTRDMKDVQSLSLHESLAIACNPLLKFMAAFVMQPALKIRGLNKRNDASHKPTTKQNTEKKPQPTRKIVSVRNSAHYFQIAENSALLKDDIPVFYWDIYKTYSKCCLAFKKKKKVLDVTLQIH